MKQNSERLAETELHNNIFQLLFKSIKKINMGLKMLVLINVEYYLEAQKVIKCLLITINSPYSCVQKVMRLVFKFCI